MKTSSKILLTVLAVVLIITAGGLISLRILIDRSFEASDGNGAVALCLNMNGGSLTGEVNGAANIKISRSVRKNSLRVNGVSNVEYIN